MQQCSKMQIKTCHRFMVRFFHIYEKRKRDFAFFLNLIINRVSAQKYESTFEQNLTTESHEQWLALINHH